MESLKEIKDNWEEFARYDPLWSILPYPEKKDNHWKIEELLKTGEEEIKSVMSYIDKLHIKIGKKEALDFGCGVGRLTQVLARYFNECYGVDISQKMIDLANHYNQYGERIKYILNCSNDLGIFQEDKFDFIYSNIVFQHLPPQYSLGYIKEFLRIIKTNGLIVFQITTEEIPKIETKFRKILKIVMPKGLRKFYKRLKYGTWAIKDMYCIEKEKLDKFIEENNGRIVATVLDRSSLPRYRGLRYFITKRDDPKSTPL